MIKDTTVVVAGRKINLSVRLAKKKRIYLFSMVVAIGSMMKATS